MENEESSAYEFNIPTQTIEKDTFNTFDSRYGNYTVLTGSRSSKNLILIGPHWYVSLTGQAIIIALGSCILYALWNFLNPLQICLYFIFFLAVVILYFAMFLSNPGIVTKNRFVSSFDDVETKQRFVCNKCCTVREDHAFHCHDCGICIIEHDHHCIWIGKCVGKYNLKLFYAFVASVPTFFVFVMFLSVWVTNQKITHKKL